MSDMTVKAYFPYYTTASGAKGQTTGEITYCRPYAEHLVETGQAEGFYSEWETCDEQTYYDYYRSHGEYLAWLTEATFVLKD